MDIDQKFGAVLVTGASTGIGKATALHLERLGFSVFATVRNERDAQALRSEAGSEAAGGLVPVLMDVTDQASIDRAKKQVSQAVGNAGLAGLVNNAGVGFVSPLEFVPLDELRWMFEVNVFGLLAVTQAFLPLLRQRRGRIMNISSTASIFVAPFHVLVDFTVYPDDPDYYLMPGSWLRRNIYEEHQNYLVSHGGSRPIKPKSTQNKVRLENVERWKGRWDILGLM